MAKQEISFYDKGQVDALISAIQTDVEWGDINGDINNQTDLMNIVSNLLTNIDTKGEIIYLGSSSVTLANEGSNTLGYHSIVTESGYTYICIGYSEGFACKRSTYYSEPVVGTTIYPYLIVSNNSGDSQTYRCGELQLRFKNRVSGCSCIQLCINTAVVLDTKLNDSNIPDNTGFVVMGSPLNMGFQLNVRWIKNNRHGNWTALSVGKRLTTTANSGIILTDSDPSYYGNPVDIALDLKTINQQSLLGSGDIAISGNASLTDNTTYYTLNIT